MADSYSNKLLSEVNDFRQLHQESGDLSILDDAIAALDRGCRDPAFLEEAEEDRARVLTRLGFELVNRFLLNNDLNDLSAAFRTFRRAVDQFSKNDLRGVDIGNAIATGIRTQDLGSDRLDVVLGTVDLYDELIDRTESGSEMYMTLMGNKANAYRQLHEMSLDPKYIEVSLATHELLLDQVPIGSTMRPGFLSNYGNALRQRYSEVGSIADLTKAVEMQELAVSSALDPDNEDLYQYTLGLSYLEKYASSHDEADLRLALNCFQRSVSLTSNDSMEIISRMATLGASISKLHHHTNAVSNLDQAISILDAALQATQESNTNLLGILAELSTALRVRHDATGNILDLQRSLEAKGRLIEAYEDDSPYLPYQLADWAILLAKSYEFQRDPKLLRLAEEGLEKAIKLTQDDEFIARCYHNLANTQKVIYEAGKSKEYLERAIHNRKEAIEKTPEGSNELAGRIAGLGRDELDLYDLSMDPSLLDSAIDRLRVASGMDCPDEVDVAGIWYTLAEFLARRHELTASQKDLEEAQVNLSKALTVTESSSVPLYLAVASSWAYWAQSRQAWREASVAFRHALDAADEIVEVQPSLLDRANRIERLEDLHVYASYSLFKVGEHIESVMALERGRARLLNHALSLRSKVLQNLAEENPGLAEAAANAASRLDAIYRQEAEILAVQPTSALSSELKGALQEWKRFASQIRGIEGYEHFGRAPSFDDVTALASIKPVVYLAPNYMSGLALIVTSSGEVNHLTLPGLSTIRIHELLERMTRLVIRGGDPLPAMDEICKWLWPNAMGPISTILGKLGISEIFIVPIGILGVLPLHAAWKPDPSQPSGRSYALDHITISYVPSAKSALETLPATHLPFQSATIIEDPTSTLPFAALESAYVLQHFSDVRLLGGEAATRAEVLNQLVGRNVLHFSCHGYSLASDPMHSGLIMAFGESLTVSDIHRIDVEQTRIVTLSACETGLIGRRMVNEALGFATAWMGLGVPCVLSAIWSVDDESTSHLMRLFYENLMTGKLRPDQALRQSQVQLRDGAVSNSDFSHPFYWGAFFVTGF